MVGVDGGGFDGECFWGSPREEFLTRLDNCGLSQCYEAFGGEGSFL